jgi:hypothetical protein
MDSGAYNPDGTKRYGPFNWQDTPIQASVYYDAIFRHLIDWYTGDDVDAGSAVGGLNLAAVRASCGILIDAFATGRIVDDRPKLTAKTRERIRQMTEAKIARMKPSKE